MINLKLSFGVDEPQKKFDIIDGELLSDAITRSIEGVPLNGMEVSEVFQVVVNDLLIEKDFWTVTALKETDIVFITPSLRSGDSSGLFKQIIVLGITAVASVYLGPALGLTGVATALATAGVTIVSSLLLNALIPPPGPKDLGGLGGQDSSQMYSIAGQSNSTKQFGNVPKVYGNHRIFANVAANPYIDLQVDPDTGEQVQYLYAIYDFGFGPALVSELMVGDTPLIPANFADYSYNWVDLNRPATDQGDWDKNLHSDFQLYKGDLQGESLAIDLNGNSDAGDPEANWQAIRNTAVNTDGVEQEIILNFVNKSGLYGYSSTGTRSYRKIVLDISFAPVGSDIWSKYNDLAAVKKFSSVGAESGTFEYVTKLGNIGTGSNAYYTAVNFRILPNTAYGVTGFQNQYIKDGINKILVVSSAGTEFIIGQPVFLDDGPSIGNITAIANYIPDPTLKELTIDRPIYYSNPVSNYSGNVTDPFTGGSTVFTPTPYSTSTTRYEVKVRTYTNGYGVAQIQRDSTSAVYSTFKFTPNNPGQYKVRVRRVNTSGPYNTQVADELSWGSLATRFARNPINTTKRHLFLELKIKATNQLSGTIQNLSATVNSVCKVYDPDTLTWSLQPTQNPAWVFVDLLTNEVNKKAIDVSRLHVDSIVEWADYCDEIPDSPPSQTFTYPRFQTNFVLDYNTTLQDVLNQVANAGQASLNIIDGKYGVLIDRRRTTPVQIFTPRNSRDFSSMRNYAPRPDALKIKYIDPPSDWQVVETVVYDNGFTEATAVDIQEITTFACTNDEQAWRFGRYMIGQNKLRQETIQITVDFEHLVCTRGDFVQITQDVMRVGGAPARVKTKVGTTITIDDSLDIDLMLSYGYVFRGVDGNITAVAALTPTSPNTFVLFGTLPSVGDLIVVGQIGTVVFDCLVKSISPNDDLTAQITLVEKADAIYDYETTDTFPDYDPRISNTVNPDFRPPEEVRNLVVADSGHDCNASGNGYDYFVDLSWDAPNSIYEFYSILVNSGKGFDEVATTRGTTYHYIIDMDELGEEHDFKVIAVSATGKKLPLASVSTVSATVSEKTEPPSDVTRLSIDITNEVLQLSWNQIADCDAKEYLIRYSPMTDGTWETSIPLLRAPFSATLASTQARTGTYLIKAIDFNGNESVNAEAAITTIPRLFNLNIIEEISDSPTFTGPKDRVVLLSNSIILDTEVAGGILDASYYSEGYYYYNDLLDLGEIYTVRLQSAIQAEGYSSDNLMSNWLTLDSVLLLADALVSDWSIETQYRSTEQLNVMSDWVTLSSITAINEGVSENFTEWRTFFIGDATGRVFQFRLRLISNNPSVTPRVYDGAIKADMPDRIDSFENLVSTALGGYVLTYPYAFKGPGTSPNVQISVDNAATGDYWTFDYKTLAGFLIRFFDKTGTPVARQFDVAVKGYGRKYTSVI